MIVSWPCGDGWFKHRSDFCVSEGHFSRVFPMTAGGWSEQNIATIATILATSCHICRFHRYCCLNAVKILTLAVIWQTLFSPLPTLKTCKPVSTTTAATIVGPRDSARDHTWNNETLEVLSFQSPIFSRCSSSHADFHPIFGVMPWMTSPGSSCCAAAQKSWGMTWRSHLRAAELNGGRNVG